MTQKQICRCFFTVFLFFLFLYPVVYAEEKYLRIIITPDATNSLELSALFENAEFRTKIEERIGAKLDVIIDTIPNIPYTDENANNPFDKNTVIFFSDPLLISRFADQKLLYELKGEELFTGLFQNFQSEQIAARYNGRQYGIILPTIQPDNRGAFFIANTDLLEKTISAPIEKSPESFKKILRKLQNEGVIPLAVYGSPSGDGFLPLLSLFDLAGNGNGEFILEDGQVVFSKITGTGEEYLSFVHDLYQEELIPKEFLNMNEYSALDMFLRGKCAMTLLYNQACIDEALKSAAMQESEFVRILLPGSAGESAPNYYSRITAVYPVNSVDIELKNAFLDAFYEESVQLDISRSNHEIPVFQLFIQESYTDQREDPATCLRYSISRMGDKLELDKAIIAPYYSKIVTGEIPLESFSAMAEKWTASGGEKMLELMTTYYDNYLNGLPIY